MDGADQTYWTDGEPYQYLSSPDDETGGDLKFWSGGQPNELLAPVTNDTAAMFMLFF